MTTSPPSSSSGGRASSAFEHLHEKVQRWVWDRGWRDLRDAQEAAIPPILAGKQDVIIAAATAGGKTEAAFLPLVSKLYGQQVQGIGVLYVAPLKALINDQFGRIEDLCAALEIPVHKWHGDVGTDDKRRVVDQPSGILLITPESLEAMFILRGPRLRRIFEGLCCVVVDELHSFFGTERGRQVQSLLHRMELVLRRRVPRIGLSATLGDMSLAAEILRPGGGPDVVQIVSAATGQELRLQVRGYEHVPPAVRLEQPGSVCEADSSSSLLKVTSGDHVAIAQHLYERLRGADNLVFANSRGVVETYADLLREMCERDRVPNEFLPHHGSLSKALREDVETRLKDRSVPLTAVCTSTLEMGIDIGTVKSVAQIGPPHSVSALRQRLGRSGRRGEPAIMRLYIREPRTNPDGPPEDQLRTSIVQSVATVNLLLERWCEPPEAGSLQLSTLVQQVLSLIAQFGGVRALDAWNTLCQTGPFRSVDQPVFASLLRALAKHDLISQAGDETLLLGLAGERLVGHYSFYAAFDAPEEYSVIAGDRNLGRLPVTIPLAEGEYILFAGRRWCITSVDADKRIVYVSASRAGRVPLFGGQAGIIHDRVRQEMRLVYERGTVPSYLDAEAGRLFMQGVETFRRFKLHQNIVVEDGSTVVVLPWRGDRILSTVLLALLSQGMKVLRTGHGIQVGDTDRNALKEHAHRLVQDGPPLAQALAQAALNKKGGKHCCFLSEDLLDLDYASHSLDVDGAWEVLRNIAADDCAVV